MTQSGVTGQEVAAVESSIGPGPGVAGRKLTAIYDYIFSRDGGAVGTRLMRGPVLPANCSVVGAHIGVTTVPTSGGSATIGLGFLTTTDINAEDAISGAPWSSTGTVDADVDIDPADASTFLALTSAGGLQMTIGTAALTAGAFHVVVTYDVSQ